LQRILVTGAGGQIGSWLVPRLRELYGPPNVLATDVRHSGTEFGSGPFQVVDATNAKAVGQAVMRHGADTVFHLAAILSAVGERDPRLAWHVNMDSLEVVLEVARQQQCAVFVPSSIGVFGSTTPKEMTPQETVMRPQTIYGVTKLAGELLCDYYHRRYEVEVRGLRFPGLVSYGTRPGGGTTDWAVDIFHHAVHEGTYTSFLEADTRMDFMYMPDAIRAAIELRTERTPMLGLVVRLVEQFTPQHLEVIGNDQVNFVSGPVGFGHDSRLPLRIREPGYHGCGRRSSTDALCEEPR
jgi:nucleoside-diphosphate-sugar epimerase